MARTLTSNTEYNRAERDLLCRLVFLFVFGSLLYDYYAHTMLHQLQRPVLRYPYVDLTYWLMHLLQLPELITGHIVVAGIVDSVLIITALLGVIAPAWRWNMILFLLLYLLYFIAFNSFGTHHTSHKVGILVIAIPFVVKDIRSFNYLWQALRYFGLFVFSSAFLWKLLRFGWLQPDQGLLIMRKNLAAFLYYQKHSVAAGLYRFVLSHPFIANGLYIAGMLLEGIFLVGFFTKRYDRVLFFASFVLVLGFSFTADANFTELLMLSLTLVNFHPLFRYLGVKRSAGAS
ncbi:hypothetical protein [Paraflavitalea pollutisoli]|uniref:hypothetical protein n=1 Tax=Paraflavitalea pollutisoli TaxID=3034143 RepID=UPI0023EDE23F|nr:hypothetical protein [Paraflavitalea sp. H1-2-19X]